MQLTIFFDHRFHLDAQSNPRSPTHYNAELFADRYLRVFDQVRVVARLQEGQRGYFPMAENLSLFSLGNWNSARELFLQRARLKREIKQQLKNSDAVLLVAPGLVATLAAKILRHTDRPYAVEMVGDPRGSLGPGGIRHPLRPLFCSLMVRQVSRQCREAASVAYVTSHTLQQQYPVSRSAFTTSYSSIELTSDALVANPRTLGKEGPIRIIHAGTMRQPYKAQDTLLRALAAVRTQGFDVQLTLLGDGCLRPSYEELACHLGIESEVTFAGQVPAGHAVRDRLDRSDLFVLPSRTEGLPRAMLEAMARGLPCIGSDVGGIPELLPDRYRFPVDDVAALASNIEQLISCPARYSAASDACLKKASEYRAPVLAARRLQHYQHLLQRTANYHASNRPADAA